MEKIPEKKVNPKTSDEKILERLNNLSTEKVEYSPESYPDLVRQFNFLKNELGLAEDITIYHPCGATDVSLSEAFPKAKLIYVDLEEKAVTALQTNGYESVVADAATYDPGNVDVVVLLNPQIPSEIPVSHVKPGGYVFANDWHENAGQLLADPAFDCLGFLAEENGELSIVPINKDNYREGAHSATFYVFRKSA